jgi:RNA polymerase sigma-70 factor, ECF subfamily
VTSDFYQTYILPYSTIIVKICRAYTYTQDDFEDYYQEVCLQIWRSFKNFRRQAEWSTWVYRVSLNVCMTLMKKAKTRHQEFVSDSLPEQAVEESREVANDDIHRLYHAIRQLSELDRAVILLYLEEHSYLQISEILGSNANNIGVKIQRIKQRLHKLLTLEEGS